MVHEKVPEEIWLNILRYHNTILLLFWGRIVCDASFLGTGISRGSFCFFCLFFKIRGSSFRRKGRSVREATFLVRQIVTLAYDAIFYHYETCYRSYCQTYPKNIRLGQGCGSAFILADLGPAVFLNAEPDLDLQSL